MSVCRIERITDIWLESHAVAAVMILTVYNVTGDTIGFRMLRLVTFILGKSSTLCYKRHIIAACSIPDGHGRSHRMGTCVAGVDAVIFI